MSCEHDCVQPPAFPATMFNRPALERVGYRIGDYARFREHSLARLNHQLALAAWTHRGADDPGIALLECGAIAAEMSSLNSEINRVLALPEVKEQYAKMGLVPGGGTPEQLDAFIRADIAKWAKVIKAASIKPD